LKLRRRFADPHKKRQADRVGYGQLEGFCAPELCWVVSDQFPHQPERLQPCSIVHALNWSGSISLCRRDDLGPAEASPGFAFSPDYELEGLIDRVHLTAALASARSSLERLGTA
jgi:hypothetical protein